MALAFGGPSRNLKGGGGGGGDDDGTIRLVLDWLIDLTIYHRASEDDPLRGNESEPEFVVAASAHLDPTSYNVSRVWLDESSLHSLAFSTELVIRGGDSSTVFASRVSQATVLPVKVYVSSWTVNEDLPPRRSRTEIAYAVLNLRKLLARGHLRDVALLDTCHELEGASDYDRKLTSAATTRTLQQSLTVEGLGIYGEPSALVERRGTIQRVVVNGQRSEGLETLQWDLSPQFSYGVENCALWRKEMHDLLWRMLSPFVPPDHPVRDRIRSPLRYLEPVGPTHKIHMPGYFTDTPLLKLPASTYVLKGSRGATPLSLYQLYLDSCLERAFPHRSLKASSRWFVQTIQAQFAAQREKERGLVGGFVAVLEVIGDFLTLYATAKTYNYDYAVERAVSGGNFGRARKLVTKVVERFTDATQTSPDCEDVAHRILLIYNDVLYRSLPKGGGGYESLRTLKYVLQELYVPIVCVDGASSGAGGGATASTLVAGGSGVFDTHDDPAEWRGKEGASDLLICHSVARALPKFQDRAMKERGAALMRELESDGGDPLGSARQQEVDWSKAYLSQKWRAWEADLPLLNLEGTNKQPILLLPDYLQRGIDAGEAESLKAAASQRMAVAEAIDTGGGGGGSLLFDELNVRLPCDTRVKLGRDYYERHDLSSFYRYVTEAMTATHLDAGACCYTAVYFVTLPGDGNDEPMSGASVNDLVLAPERLAQIVVHTFDKREQRCIRNILDQQFPDAPLVPSPLAGTLAHYNAGPLWDIGSDALPPRKEWADAGKALLGGGSCCLPLSSKQINRVYGRAYELAEALDRLAEALPPRAPVLFIHTGDIDHWDAERYWPVIEALSGASVGKRHSSRRGRHVWRRLALGKPRILPLDGKTLEVAISVFIVED